MGEVGEEGPRRKERMEPTLRNSLGMPTSVISTTVSSSIFCSLLAFVVLEVVVGGTVVVVVVVVTVDVPVEI